MLLGWRHIVCFCVGVLCFWCSRNPFVVDRDFDRGLGLGLVRDRRMTGRRLKKAARTRKKRRASEKSGAHPKKHGARSKSGRVYLVFDGLCYFINNYVSC